MLRLALLFTAILLPFVAHAASDLTVLPQGRYQCWTSGAASGPALNAEPERSFAIVRGSSYTSGAGGGTYLLASDVLTFTRGPFKDLRFRRHKDGYWQNVGRDGGLARLKCHRTGPSLSSEPVPSAPMPDPVTDPVTDPAR